MADTPQTLALIILAQSYAQQIVRQTNRSSVALRVLPIRAGEGKNVAWAVESTGAVAEAYADGADASNFGSDDQDGPYLPWALARSNFRVTGLARSSAKTSHSPDGNKRLWARNIVNASGALASLINGYVYSGTGSANQPVGLAAAIGDDTNTYATLDRSVDTFWQPYVVDPGSLTAITQSQIRTDLKNIYDNSGEFPDLGLVSSAVFNSILGLFDSRQQLVKTIDSVTTARGTVQLSGNYKGIEVEGVTFLRDKDATANRIYYVNSNHVEIQIQIQPELEEMGLVPGEIVTANDGYGPVPLLAVIEGLAKSGDSQKAMIKTYYQIVCNRPNSCGCRKNIAVAA